MLPTVELVRNLSTDQGTPGKLTLPEGGSMDGWTCFTLECPWRDNQRRISCIPFGSYICEIVDSPKFGRVYEVQGVPGRSAILIHSGNYGGDKSLGYRSDIMGCILLGMKRGMLSGQEAVLSSRVARDEFMRRMDGQSFILNISK